MSRSRRPRPPSPGAVPASMSQRHRRAAIHCGRFFGAVVAMYIADCAAGARGLESIGRRQGVSGLGNRARLRGSQHRSVRCGVQQFLPAVAEMRAWTIPTGWCGCVELRKLGAVGRKSLQEGLSPRSAERFRRRCMARSSVSILVLDVRPKSRLRYARCINLDPCAPRRRLRRVRSQLGRRGLERR